MSKAQTRPEKWREWSEATTWSQWSPGSSNDCHVLPRHNCANTHKTRIRRPLVSRKIHSAWPDITDAAQNFGQGNNTMFRANCLCMLYPRNKYRQFQSIWGLSKPRPSSSPTPCTRFNTICCLLSSFYPTQILTLPLVCVPVCIIVDFPVCLLDSQSYCCFLSNNACGGGTYHIVSPIWTARYHPFHCHIWFWMLAAPKQRPWNLHANHRANGPVCLHKTAHMRVCNSRSNDSVWKLIHEKNA